MSLRECVLIGLQIGAGDPSLGGAFIKDVIEGKRDEDVGKVITSTMIQAW